MNEVIAMQTNRNRKKIAPWIVAIAVVVLAGVYIGFLIWAQLTIHEVNGASIFIGIYIAVLAATIVGIIIALRQRLNEIDGGEEDEALQY